MTQHTTGNRQEAASNKIADYIYQIWLKAREGYMMDVREDLQTAVEMIDRT